jgi:hypothetical protein
MLASAFISAVVAYLVAGVAKPLVSTITNEGEALVPFIPVNKSEGEPVVVYYKPPFCSPPQLELLDEREAEVVEVIEQKPGSFRIRVKAGYHLPQRHDSVRVRWRAQGVPVVPK